MNIIYNIKYILGGFIIMEYTKDLVLNVSYGQAGGTNKEGKLERIWHKISKHKFISSVVGVTLLLSILDFMLVASFVNVLNGIVI